jgi:hypothetical protein
MRYIGGQFVFCFAASLFVTLSWFESRSRNYEALKRMMAVTEGRVEIRAANSEASPIPTGEYDGATGVDAEEENKRLFDMVSKSDSTYS